MFCISSVAPSIRVLKSRTKSTRFCCNPMLFYGERDTIESYCVTRSESMRRKVISAGKRVIGKCLLAGRCRVCLRSQPFHVYFSQLYSAFDADEMVSGALLRLVPKLITPTIRLRGLPLHFETGENMGMQQA